ncbi:MAG: hypothetical protein N3E46_02670, partial [Gemmataceae bacterium]|nr:hypothetical protein [Gemmataceae bacterium]
ATPTIQPEALLPPPTPLPAVPQLPGPTLAVPVTVPTITTGMPLGNAPPTNASAPTAIPATPSYPANSNGEVAAPPQSRVMPVPGKPYQLVLPPAVEPAPGAAAGAAPPTVSAAEPARRRLFGTKEGRLWNPFGH